MRISRAVGIDLGTTYSRIGILDMEYKVIHLWKDGFGKATVPSVVQWDPEKKEFKVGEDALLTRHKKPYPIRSIKRSMGFNVAIEHGDIKMHPEDVSAEILKFLKKCGETLVAEKFGKSSDGKTPYIVDRAIVTIPAYFNNPQIEATRKAAELSGLKTLELLHEPTAATLYYCWHHKINDGNFLVYDLGGGTFDVSILRRSEGVFEILGICGDMVLGGDTFDMALASFILDNLKKGGKYNLNLDVQKDPQDKALFDYYVWRAEGIKMQLSTEMQVLFCDGACPFPDKNGNAIHVEMKITRPQFEELIAPHINRSIDEIVKTALNLASEKAKGTFKGLEDIDYILLVGGSTWIPFVKSTVREKLCKKGDKPGRAKCEDVFQDEPDECVAMGAALQAAASGGIIYKDEENNLSVHIKSAALVSNEEYRLRGNVYRDDPEKEKAGSPFNGYSINLLQDGESFGETEVGVDGGFCFEGIYLDPGKASKVTLALHNLEHKEIGRYTRTVGLGEGVGNEGATVNSQPIWLWVLKNNGAWVKEILVEASESLPCEKEFLFFTDNPKMITFWLYQGNVEIKKVTQTFDVELPIGTKIDFSMHLDIQSNIIIRSKIEGLAPFVMELEPPPPPKPPTKEDVDNLNAQFNAIKTELQPIKRKMAEQKVNNLIEEINTALAQGDTALAFERIVSFKGIIDEISASKVVLNPSHDKFDELVESTREAIGSVRAELGSKADEFLKNIDAQVQIATKAYQDAEQQTLSECEAAINTIKEFAESKVKSKAGSGESPPLNLIVPFLSQRFMGELQILKRDCKDASVASEIRGLINNLETIPVLLASEQEAQQYIPLIQKAQKIIEKVKKLTGCEFANHASCPSSCAQDNGGESETYKVGRRHNASTMPCSISDLVHFSVTSPPVIMCGTTFLMDVWAHLEVQRQEVIRRAREEAGGTNIQIKSRGPVRIERGNVLVVHLRIDGFVIDSPQDSILWEGEIGNATFPIKVPKETKLGSHDGICDFHMNGLKISTLNFTIKVGPETVESTVVNCTETRTKRAFASYASADLDAVLARIQGLQKGAPDLEVFLDVVSLRSGQNWKDTLRKEILSSDVLYLFWSKAASLSKWVDWEWRCGYEEKGLNFIDPVPLVSPEEVTPPRELSDLHFKDWILAYMRGNLA